MDVTPLIPKGKNIITGYGDMAFKINGDEHKGSIILLPDNVTIWQASDVKDININSLKQISNDSDIEILLISCGEIHIPLDQKIATHFSKSGINTEIMTTGAACRTYNVLLSEERKVAAALLAI